MIFLLDQGLPRTAATILRSRGIQALHFAECGLASATDAVIVAHALAHHQAIVTLDADFHSMIALVGKAQPSAVRVRIEGLRHQELAELVEKLHNHSLCRGASRRFVDHR